jgi:hypothetical protein
LIIRHFRQAILNEQFSFEFCQLHTQPGGVMKLHSKVSVFGAVLALGTALASADTIQLGSYQTGGPSLGNNNTAVAFVGSPTTTFMLSPGSAWAPAGAGSVYVSNNAGSGPGGSVVEPVGTYSYTTTFNTLPGGGYTGSIYVLADDTTDVIFNGHLLQPEGTLGTDAHCSDGPPNCVTATLITLPGADFLTGPNTLQFDVLQTVALTGLDFYGSASSPIQASLPEPGTLFLIGTGLIAAAGTLRKRLV